MRRQSLLRLLGVAAVVVLAAAAGGGHLRHLVPAGGHGSAARTAHGDHPVPSSVLGGTDCARLDHGIVAEGEQHIFLIHAVDVQPMYSRRQARRLRPTTGELVLSGAPTEVRGDPDQWVHLGVHVCRRDSGQVARGDVTLALVPQAGPIRRIPVVAMQEIDGGPLTYHYGNNVPDDGRGRSRLLIRFNGDRVEVTDALRRHG